MLPDVAERAVAEVVQQARQAHAEHVGVGDAALGLLALEVLGPLSRDICRAGPYRALMASLSMVYMRARKPPSVVMPLRSPMPSTHVLMCVAPAFG